MIKGIGTDITGIPRIKKLIEEKGHRFLNKILSAEEISLISGKGSEHFTAGRFAAKEAIVKAMGSSFEFSRLSILNDPKGKPYAANPEFLFGDEEGITLHLSISHDKDYATAVAIIEQSK
jgi:holo-[acyl-carrier protein] synthase